MDTEIKQYLKVQNIVLRTLHEIASFIQIGTTEKMIANECTRLLEKAGIKDWWYHGIPAFVLVGKRSILSISGRDYIPSDTQVQMGDLVTIDLSPEIDGYWGDCARSYTVDGAIDAELSEGIEAEKQLHRLMQSIATPKMTMHDLYVFMNEEIKKLGYQNLDFKGNLGHSIEKEINKRRYIEAGNTTALGELLLFTFEPHISKLNSKHGFKRENIYYFENDKLIPLGNHELLEVI
jgi:Xaa-Pro aminopeptidase